MTDRIDPSGQLVAGRYELVRALGRGSFGRTYLARDRTAGHEVAIKVLDPRGTPDWKAYELFEREAAVLRSLRHHGVPEVHELVRGDWLGSPAAFLVMEYVAGASLEQTIEEQRQLAPAEALHLFDELLGILEYLHGRVPPVLHRDIKPSNIVVRPDGFPALVDFGSVRRVQMAAEEAGSTVVGTYGYMPYEQYMGQASAASDLYALAATFLHLVTGRPPREFMNAEGRIEVPELGDRRLRPVLARMLRPSPAERPANAREVRQMLLSAGGAAPAESPVASVQPVAVALLPAHASLPAALAEPAPRAIQGATADLLRRVAPSALELMDSNNKPEPWGVLDWVTVGFFSVLTVGILPLLFTTLARSRRRRVRRFIQLGTPAAAQITAIRQEKIAFDVQMSRVSYQFDADGAIHRDTDDVLPVVADRWRPGDTVQVLYMAGQDYDSIIVSR
jgi:serine/threonine protein kinase